MVCRGRQASTRCSLRPTSTDHHLTHTYNLQHSAETHDGQRVPCHAYKRTSPPSASSDLPEWPVARILYGPPHFREPARHVQLLQDMCHGIFTRRWVADASDPFFDALSACSDNLA